MQKGIIRGIGRMEPMKKIEYLDMLVAENTEGENKGLYADVIDCIDIALSQ